jgi:hypothetical protein
MTRSLNTILVGFTAIACGLLTTSAAFAQNAQGGVPTTTNGQAPPPGTLPPTFGGSGIPVTNPEGSMSYPFTQTNPDGTQTVTWVPAPPAGNGQNGNGQNGNGQNGNGQNGNGQNANGQNGNAQGGTPTTELPPGVDKITTKGDVTTTYYKDGNIVSRNRDGKIVMWIAPAASLRVPFTPEQRQNMQKYGVPYKIDETHIHKYKDGKSVIVDLKTRTEEVIGTVETKTKQEQKAEQEHKTQEQQKKLEPPKEQAPKTGSKKVGMILKSETALQVGVKTELAKPLVVKSVAPRSESVAGGTLSRATTAGLGKAEAPTLPKVTTSNFANLASSRPAALLSAPSLTTTSIATHVAPITITTRR